MKCGTEQCCKIRSHHTRLEKCLSKVTFSTVTQNKNPYVLQQKMGMGAEVQQLVQENEK